MYFYLDFTEYFRGEVVKPSEESKLTFRADFVHKCSPLSPSTLPRLIRSLESHELIYCQ